ncbi:hypothetical protein ABGT15_09350 [Flavobacterium enshiense]|uniref:hypothetical protein n=1 Tax=Flavobacterium enshiense TaxID=1341165 RepID=UPI00345CB2DB
MRKILPVLLGVVLLSSCDSKEPVTCILPDPSISSNSPVMSGDEIQLSSTDAPAYEATYHWTGPNGFESDQQNPVIPAATAAMGGTYKLTITKGICATEEISTTVNVINNTITCTPNNNTGTFSHLFYPVSYYSTTAVQTGENTFQLRGGESNSSLEITFASSDYPSAGMYTIVPPGSNMTANQVTVTNTTGYVYSNITEYFAKTGEVLVSYSNGKMYAVLCSVPFYYEENTSSSYTGTVKITEE